MNWSPYLRGILLAPSSRIHRLALSQHDEAGAEDGARVPQPEGLVQAHQLPDVLLRGRPQCDHSAYATVELKMKISFVEIYAPRFLVVT